MRSSTERQTTERQNFWLVFELEIVTFVAKITGEPADRRHVYHVDLRSLCRF